MRGALMRLMGVQLLLGFTFARGAIGYSSPTDTGDERRRPSQMAVPQNVPQPSEASAITTKVLDGIAFAVEDSVFYVSPGDQLKLRWWGIGEGTVNLVVNTRWELVVPDMGVVNVRGATLKQVREELIQLLRSHIRVKMMDLQLVKLAPAQVQITGLVPKPGVYDILPGARLSEALKMAGIQVGEELRSRQTASPPGPNDNFRLPSLRRVLVVRGSGRDSLWSDLVKAYNGGDADADPRIFTGDRIRVYPQGPILTVSGDAPFAGNAEFVPGETIDSFVKVVGLVQCPATVWAIRTTGERVPLNGTMPLDTGISLLELTPVTYGLRNRLVWVNGFVQKPGAYLYREGMTAKDLIALAGGSRGNEDSTTYLCVKRDWQKLKVDMRHWEDATQFAEVKQQLLAYQLQMRGTYSDPMALLQAGDTVLVRQAESVVWVSGAVNRPGYVQWKRGATLDDYVALAGGYASRAWMDNVKMYDPYTNLPIAVGQAIRPGTAILVPETKYLYMDQWITLAATMIGTVVSLATFYMVSK
jgi:protein involved in polysaccharide export with SLBB domain